MSFQNKPEEFENSKEQTAQLWADLNENYPTPTVPNNEELATWLAEWMLRQIVASENRFMGLEAVLNVSQSWLITRKAGLS